MFSYEDRNRAVKLYIKLGKRLGVTIRQLGYPTKNSLIESPRDLRRLQPLRRWSHEQEIKSFFPRSSRTRCSHGSRAPW
jgi:hypothetical protein